MQKRLKSLDVLRGLNMFVLTVFTAWLAALCHCVPGLDFLLPQLTHNPFGSTTLTSHDLIMPLFLFCSGTAIPFAFAAYREEGRSRGRIYWRIIRRVAVLWVMGMICQGKLLTYQPAEFRYFSNTLQSIAVGYGVSALLFLHTKPRHQLMVAAGLLLAYWALMTFVRVDGFGGGDYGAHNLCEWVDRTVLGSHCDHAIHHPDGFYSFAGPGYTWILSSLNFIVTVMTGMFAGELLKTERGTARNKAAMLLVLGAGMYLLGKVWGLQMPVNKYIWTSTMTLVSSGICFGLLAAVHFLTEGLGWKGLDWLLPFGLNAIFIYFIPFICDFSSISAHFSEGLGAYLPGPWLRLVQCTLHGVLVYGLLLVMMKKKVFLRV